LPRCGHALAVVSERMANGSVIHYLNDNGVKAKLN
jgi:hypothetical protein